MFSSICRVCLCNGDNLVSIFQSYRGISLGDKIMACSTVQISSTDQLPAQICNKCVNRVNDSYNFKLQCEDSDIVLRKKLSENRVESNASFSIKNEQTYDQDANNYNVKWELPCEYSDNEKNKSEVRVENQHFKNERSETSFQGEEIPLEIEPLIKSENERVEDSYSSENDSDEMPLSVKYKSLRKRSKKRKSRSDEYYDETDEDGKKRKKRKKSTSKQNPSEDLAKVDKETLKVPCPTCGKVLANKVSLRQHMKIHGVKNYKCNYCDKRFVLPRHRTFHERVHTGEKPILCNFCGKSFTTHSTLNSHRRIHTGEKPYKCTLCPSTYRLRGHLVYHMKLHLGEKNFKCTVCDKAFVTKFDVKSHMISHSGERNFVCSVCGKSMTRSHHLKLHMMTHTGERPYKCDICNQSFIQKGYWKQHMNKHNSNEITAQHTENKTVPDNDKVDYNTNFEKM